MRDEKTNSAGDSLVARLEKLETGLVSDVLDEAGLPNQVVSSSLSALVTGVRFAGRAACVSGEPFIASRNPSPLSRATRWNPSSATRACW